MARVGWDVEEKLTDPRGFCLKRADGIVSDNDVAQTRSSKPRTIRRIPSTSRPDRSSTGNRGARF